ncbi:DNA mismatch repair endonuclease MutL [Alishewanella sp. SMS8]|uniref:DNA mismatch repair endonuclease MutL n=1 Tax=Alishewanella sp. SMS8 TaxID=2994676 RepID=UPI0027421C46|nr:DNA mismatch repair endonuclease MutL [Alishewanella sp. SMS8]MDP5206724.1 DNA mismatch repair endonuclease MutL [Alishewanella sp. SMS9]MDP5458695.1 DNA mismatch repair endonuclease MutL [Alishewanella sp. SMS8]
MPIQLLPAQLANQIAAGEVVERPASVVKELVENSLDAQATQIDIELEKGGSKLIRIRDNGVGIAEAELVLALSRHATSKISSLADLEQIESLGFRGEALASISSVARLTLTSKPAQQAAAWQASAEGRDMEVELRPAAHPDGTSIDVVDLFFNTPARRRFLRSDKTEFTHIDELIKRLALSRFDVAWQLSHNGQVVRRLPVADTAAAKQKRLALICGRNFAEQALWIENQYGEIKLSGWILPAMACQAISSGQYSYVNGRMMRDKLLNHAIRQAYGDWLAAELQPAFVLYLELPANDVDVNVHPAKHEVRFHQARLVHDFVVSALADALTQGQDSEPKPALAAESPSMTTSQTQVASPQPNSAAAQAAYATRHAATGYTKAPLYQPQQGRVKARAVHDSVAAKPAVASVQAQINYQAATLQAATEQVASPTPHYFLLENRFALCQEAEQLFMVDLPASIAIQWQLKVQSAPLLLPVRLTVASAEFEPLLAAADNLSALGFDLLLKDRTVIIRAVPIWLRHTAIGQWFGEFLSTLITVQTDGLAEALLDVLLRQGFLQADLLLGVYPAALSKAQRRALALSFDAATLQIRKANDAH